MQWATVIMCALVCTLLGTAPRHTHGLKCGVTRTTMAAAKDEHLESLLFDDETCAMDNDLCVWIAVMVSQSKHTDENYHLNKINQQWLKAGCANGPIKYHVLLDLCADKKRLDTCFWQPIVFDGDEPLIFGYTCCCQGNLCNKELHKSLANQIKLNERMFCGETRCDDGVTQCTVPWEAKNGKAHDKEGVKFGCLKPTSPDVPDVCSPEGPSSWWIVPNKPNVRCSIDAGNTTAGGHCCCSGAECAGKAIPEPWSLPTTTTTTTTTEATTTLNSTTDHDSKVPPTMSVTKAMMITCIVLSAITCVSLLVVVFLIVLLCRDRRAPSSVPPTAVPKASASAPDQSVPAKTKP